ncbi:hypothetical protein V491_05810 [Pseudogymnoascus sp. VKM F-3775]|nr:hypothetical protein V491_05810 [Pseudogymnoascus sp. VKM F-3775]
MSAAGTGTITGGPAPVDDLLAAKQEFAASMIKEEQDDMDRHGWDVVMAESNWAELPQTDYTRKLGAGRILSGMVIRGRLQATILDTFMELCLQGVCSLSALERPMDWHNWGGASDCHRWINRMIYDFSCIVVDMDLVQAKWGIRWASRWHDYRVHIAWLATMIARSFNSLDSVFNTIERKGMLGPVNAESLKRLEENFPPNPDWKADIGPNSTNGWALRCGYGAFEGLPYAFSKDGNALRCILRY